MVDFINNIEILEYNILRYSRNNIPFRAIKCRCYCGKIFFTRLNDLKHNRVKSCGCRNREKIIARNKANATHRLTHTPIWNLWSSIKYRCLNPRSKKYKDYGGRGIDIDKNWLVFDNFYNDIKDIYQQGLSIDRIDNNKGYYKNNVRFTDYITQANNRRNTNKYLWKGEYLPLREIAMRENVDYNLIHNRVYDVRKGKVKMTFDEIILRPKRRPNV